MTVHTGAFITPKVRLAHPLGEGGMGAVWVADHLTLERQVAVKLIRGIEPSDEARSRFEREAKAAARISSPHVVQIFDYGITGQEQPYIIMELLQGESLGERLARGPVPPAELATILVQTASALASAHDSGVVHRDIKPANILLDRDGAPKLVDFDLVTDTHTGGDTNTSTIDNIIYAAPEVLNRPQDADKRADVYALGMIALFVLRRATLPMDSLRGVGRLIADLDCDRRLKQVVARAVARDPAERYQRADDFCDALALAAADATASLAGAEPMDEEAVPDTVRESPTPQPLQPMAGAHATTVTAPTPAWASAHGEDRHGRWASFTIDGVEQRLRLIPAGTFVMGSPDDEEGRFEDEGPQHAVRIERAFWLADTPCTQAMWKAVMGTAPSAFQGEQRPVERVSHTDVQAFLRRLREHHPALHPRLPSEAEWEYACRADFSWSLYALHDNRRPAERSLVAWYAANAGRTTRPVAQKAPNAWGLYDMLGNVWEWCADTLCDYAEMSDGGSGPTKEASGRRSAPLAVRGGCWANVARNVRAACRNAYPTRVALNQLGFRVAGSG